MKNKKNHKILLKEEKEAKNKIINLNSDSNSDLSEKEKTPKDKKNKKCLKNKKDKTMNREKSADDLLNKKRKLKKDEESKKLKKIKKRLNVMNVLVKTLY